MRTVRDRWRQAALLVALATAGGAAVVPSYASGAKGSSPADAPCQCLWVDRFDGPAANEDDPSSVAVSPDGAKVFVTGRSKSASTGFDYATIAYSTSTGARLWLQRYDGPASLTDAAFSIAVSPDGTKVFVTGYSLTSTSSADYETIAYGTAHGGLFWQHRYHGPAGPGGTAVAIRVSPDGSKVFVTGYGKSNSYDYETVAYAATTGNLLWAARYIGPGNNVDQAMGLAVSPDSSEVFVTGRSFLKADDYDYATLAYDASTGAVLWTQRYNGPGHGSLNNNDFAQAIAVSPDGSKVFVTGSSQGPNWADYTTIAYDAVSGAQLWLSRYDGPAHDRDVPNAIAVSPDGTKVFVTGESNGAYYAYATVAYDAASGAQLWAGRVNWTGTGDDYADALGVSPDGSQVFVTGESHSLQNNNRDFATYAYDAATGTREWSRRYNGPAGFSDYAVGLAVARDGSKLFVTGPSQGASSNPSGYDYATLAYPTTPP